MAGKYKLILKDSSKNILEQLNEGAIYTVDVELIGRNGQYDRLMWIKVLANDISEVPEVVRQHYDIPEDYTIRLLGNNPKEIEEPEEFLLRALSELNIAYKRY